MFLFALCSEFSHFRSLIRIHTHALKAYIVKCQWLLYKKGREKKGRGKNYSKPVIKASFPAGAKTKFGAISGRLF